MALKNTPLFAESWNVAFRRKPSGSILSDTESPFIIIKNSFRYWAADPFIVEHEGHTYIFAELYDYIRRRGILGFCEIQQNKTTKWKPIIIEPYHLSYPSICMIDGKYRIIPESGGGNNLTVYEAEQFPYKWKRPTVVRDGVKFADTTLLFNDHIGLALTHQVEDANNPKLTLIDIHGRHEDKTIDNAVPFRSRPAGCLFSVNGRRIRPAQLSENCGDGYGKALVFYQCNFSEDTEYAETELKEIYPQDLRYTRTMLLDGMHTYNSSEHYEVIDIKTRRFNILNLFMRVFGKILR